jgi:ABC-2 type transport system permease protein
VLAVPVAFAATMLQVATRLSDRRDFGAGLFARRPGRAEATRWLATPLGLAVRLHRNLVLGWAVGIVALGFFYGVVADQAETMVEDNPDLAEFLAGGGGSITDAFLATGLLVVGLLAGGFVVSAALRLRAEESAGRADPLLAAPVSRTRWAASHAIVAFVAVVLLTTIGGLAEGLGAAASTGEAAPVVRVGAAGLAMAPAPAVLGGVAFLLCTAAPRWTMAAWGAVVLAATMGLLGEVLDLPSWVRGVSPFEHLPAMPGEAFEPVPALLLVLVSAVLAGAGFMALRRRDLGIV